MARVGGQRPIDHEQRKLTAIEERGGGLTLALMLAQRKGVHLLELTDDKGAVLVAASLSPFKVIC